MSDDTKTESVYERAFKALHEACSRGRLKMTIPVDEQHDHDCLIAAGLTAGEAAEKRAVEAERERDALKAVSTDIAQDAHDRVLERLGAP
jgi:hypothetical protein